MINFIIAMSVCIALLFLTTFSREAVATTTTIFYLYLELSDQLSEILKEVKQKETSE